MSLLQDIFKAAFWGEDTSPLPNWVEWKHIPYGESHCSVCLKLDQCWFTKDCKPKLPQHPHCHCEVEAILLSDVNNQSHTVSDIGIMIDLCADLGYDRIVLKKEVEKQSLEQYTTGNYILGKLDENGQEIYLEFENETHTIVTGWLVEPKGKIELVAVDYSAKEDLNDGLGAYGINRGHHILAKKAFEGEVGYNLYAALSISVDKLEDLDVKHAAITGQQYRLYTAYAKTGRPLTMEAMKRMEIQAMVSAGIPPDYAFHAVNEAIDDLISRRITHPVKIPWNE